VAVIEFDLPSLDSLLQFELQRLVLVKMNYLDRRGGGSGRLRPIGAIRDRLRLSISANQADGPGGPTEWAVFFAFLHTPCAEYRLLLHTTMNRCVSGRAKRFFDSIRDA
jgi:hypothetical protein